MGKINGRMPKKGSSTTPDENDISQTVIHKHEWHFVNEYWHDAYFTVLKSKFVCLCGAVKRVKQFEVEE